MMVNDHIGVTNSTEAYGSYAYHIRFRKSKLAMGIQAGITSYTSKLSDLVYWDPNDPVFEIPTQSSLLPNFGGGFYYYSERYYAGLSLPFSISYSPLDNLGVKNIENTYHVTRHYFFTAGGMIGRSRELKARPSVLVKYVENAPVQYDVNLNFLINEIFWVGGSYRSEDAIVAIFEFQMSRKLRIGYSADYSLSRLKNHSAGSHEIMIGYDFGYNILKMKTPRYF
jgi:type IX secretion system PorP/SprF family membrane protein